MSISGDATGHNVKLFFSLANHLNCFYLYFPFTWEVDKHPKTRRDISYDFYIAAHTPNYEAVNQPQSVAGITDCDAEISNYDHWQPICVPVEVGSDDCKVRRILQVNGALDPICCHLRSCEHFMCSKPASVLYTFAHCLWVYMAQNK